mgnify:CR=1 FL=1|jgi:hypothetical protein
MKKQAHIRAESNKGFYLSDGGRSLAGYKGYAGDCVARALSHFYFEERDLSFKHLDNFEERKAFCYKLAYDWISARMEKAGMKRSARNGCPKHVFEPIFKELGLVWNSCMFKNAKVRHRIGNLPRKASYIIRLAGHIVYGKNNVIYDTWDSSQKMVYGFWAFKKYETFGDQNEYEAE